MRRRWLRRTAIALAAFAVLSAAAIYWLFYDNRMPHEGTFKLDLAAVRAEAARMPGAKPQRIEVEIVSRQMVPEIVMVAGGSWAKSELVRTSYRLVAPDRSILIDTAYDASTAHSFAPNIAFDEAAFARVRAAMEDGTAIVVTHEHSDHIGGLMTHPRLSALLSKALLNPEQLAVSDKTAPLAWPAGSRARYVPFAYQGIRAIAPGVVLIRAPGHTPGSQMIYVQRADGREFLFMGDVASMADNVRLQRIRSRLVTDWFTHEDRNAVMLQTQALGRLQKDAPGLILVPGHDGETIAALAASGALKTGFTP